MPIGLCYSTRYSNFWWKCMDSKNEYDRKPLKDWMVEVQMYYIMDVGLE